MHATNPFQVFALKNMDRMRQARGRLLDQLGYGPQEAQFAVLHSEAGLKLRKYAGGPENGPPVLLVPAPIKKAYIWDLMPDVSVVRRWLEKGYQVYLAEWVPGTGPHFGLDDYADRLLSACQQVIAADSGHDKMTVAGHSLGGVLATIYSCLHPETVQATVLLESPLHFGSDIGCFAHLIHSTPDARPIAQAYSEVPGVFLNMVSAMAAPHAFQLERVLDRFLCAGNPQALATHMRVERWTHDEFPLPGRLFTEVVEFLYREDQLTCGALCIGSGRIGPQNMTAPLLNVIDPRSTVIPARSVLPFHDAAASQVKRVLHYEGDIGVCLQHVGVLVGRSAHEKIWPAIFDWLRTDARVDEPVAD
jgi:polyhydroxyalkanoate synthase subunit PhaC